MVVPGNEQARRRPATPHPKLLCNQLIYPAADPKPDPGRRLHEGSRYSNSGAPQGRQIPDTSPKLPLQSCWHAHDLSFPTSPDVSTLPALQ